MPWPADLVPRRQRSVPRLVPQRARHWRVAVRGARALSSGRRRRAGSSTQAGRAMHKSAGNYVAGTGGDGALRRRRAAAVVRVGRVHGRHALRRDAAAKRRQRLPQPALSLAYPARDPRRLRPWRPGRRRATSSRSIVWRSSGSTTSRGASPTTMPRTDCTTFIWRSSTSTPTTSRGSTSTRSRTASTRAHATPPAAAAAQTAALRLLRGLLAMLAPILSFTAEEAWQPVPERLRGDALSVFDLELPHPHAIARARPRRPRPVGGAEAAAVDRRRERRAARLPTAGDGSRRVARRRSGSRRSATTCARP